MMALAARHNTQQGNYAAARENISDALAYLELCSQYESRAQIMNLFSIAYSGLINGIQDPNWPSDQWGDVPGTLEKLDAKLVDAPALKNELVAEYLADRRKVISRLDAPWYGTIFGWPSDDRAFYYQTTIFGMDVELPKVKKYLDMTSKAMARKRRSAEALKSFDAEKQRSIKRFDLTYPDRYSTAQAAQAESKGNDQNIFFKYYVTEADRAAEEFVVMENNMHLARVGLLLRTDPAKARTLHNEDLRGRPHHPWRDPFSEKPYQIEETTSGTLVYSLGFTLDPKDGRRGFNMTIHVPTSPKR